jgi:hydrogenase maturation protein HypF
MIPAPTTRLKLAIRGAVQGVGFRPFVHRLATELQVAGWVNNSPQGVFIEAEGTRAGLERFLRRLETEKPPRSSIQNVEAVWLHATGYHGFEIRDSDHTGAKTALVLPDLATCSACEQEISDPRNRRYRYPFTNCTQCGPRFSIIESLPYDRSNTSMKKFGQCPACQAEYNDPTNHRFHAQPNACPVCGPRLELWNHAGEVVFGGDEALRAAAQAIRRGRIVAVKGIGGFHLLVDARNEDTVSRLRERKHREEKPFALMFPSLAGVRSVCEVSSLEECLLGSPAAPIVLLKKITPPNSSLARSIAPGNPCLGVMLPSNPLHHLLMTGVRFPVVATSGNLRDEPICTDEFEALERLRDIADLFLVHNRPIVRHLDDSIVRVILDREMILRRARGYAPLPVLINNSKLKKPAVLAVGAHLKNSIALACGEQVFLSQHIGDLETEPANAAFRRVTADFQKLYDTKPLIVAADLHPDYRSTQYARELKAGQYVGLQHHLAHVLSCVAENEIKLPALGVAWDGTGLGTDGTIWGGEFFLVADSGARRVANFRPFRLPGADKAVREPRRAALGLLYEAYGDMAFEMNDLAPLQSVHITELSALKGMLQRQLNSPLTSSAGRLFDAIASLVNLRQQTRFEGQSAMELEFAREGFQTDACYPLPLLMRRGSLQLDWAPMLREILANVRHAVCPGEISARFHNALAEAIVMLAKHFGEPRVALSGGCFQNRYLLEHTVERLRAEHFQPFWHQHVPTNDGGIALGQVFAARQQLNLK